MSDFNLDDILLRWRVENGKLVKSKKWDAPYYQIVIPERLETLRILVLELKNLGKSKDFFTNSTRDKIVESFTPHRTSFKTHNGYEGFKTSSKADLNTVIEEIYLREEIFIRNTEKEKPSTDILPNIKIFDPSKITDRMPPIKRSGKTLNEILGIEDDE